MLSEVFSHSAPIVSKSQRLSEWWNGQTGRGQVVRVCDFAIGCTILGRLDRGNT